MSENTQSEKPVSTNWQKQITGALLGAAAVYAYMNWDTVSVQIFGGSAYTCKSLIQEVVQASEKNGTILQPKVIGVIDPKEISKTKTRIECTGTGMFTNGLKTPINYRAYEEGGQWWVFYEGKP